MTFGPPLASTRDAATLSTKIEIEVSRAVFPKAHRAGTAAKSSRAKMRFVSFAWAYSFWDTLHLGGTSLPRSRSHVEGDGRASSITLGIRVENEMWGGF